MNSDENEAYIANTDSSIRPKASLGQARNTQAYNLKSNGHVDLWAG